MMFQHSRLVCQGVSISIVSCRPMASYQGLVARLDLDLLPRVDTPKFRRPRNPTMPKEMHNFGQQITASADEL